MTEFANPPVITGPAPTDGQVPAWDAASGTWVARTVGGGGGAGSPVVRAFDFAFDTPDLATGAALYTPTPGDLVLDAFMDITTAWDGTTPFGDIGVTFDPDGWWRYAAGPGHMQDMTIAGGNTFGGVRLLYLNGNGSLKDYDVLGEAVDGLRTSFGDNPVALNWADPLQQDTVPSLPIKFLTDDPLRVLVSTNGETTGVDPGSTQGAATLYLVTVTPAT